jgi:hypothetical protein
MGLGLENIRQRYQLISNLNVAVLHGEKHFVVKLPLIPA